MSYLDFWSSKVFLGHYAPAFIAKAVDQRIPLWLLFVAAQFLDLVWDGLVLLGVEHARIVPGITKSNPLDLFFMPYSHSLVAAVVWSVIAFLACLLIPRIRGDRGAASLVGLVVLSHWLLDLPVHRPDLPLYDNSLKQGFGLWNYPVAAFLLEAAVLLIVVCVFFWFARGTPRAKWIVGLGVVMVFVQALVSFGPDAKSLPQVVGFAVGVYLASTIVALLLERPSRAQ